MRTAALVVGLAAMTAAATAASAAPRYSTRTPVPAVNVDTQPRTTGSLSAPPARGLGQGSGLFGDPATWGRRGPGLPSPINPLGYTGE